MTSVRAGTVPDRGLTAVVQEAPAQAVPAAPPASAAVQPRSEPSSRRPVRARLRAGVHRARAAITTLPGLLGCFAVITLLAMGPLQAFDAATTRRWVLEYTPSWEPLVQHFLAPITGQAVCLPVLLLVGVVLARRLRSWRPLLVVLLTEVAFYGGIGTIKVVFARPATILGDPRLFAGGVFEHGAHGIVYPSGHAAEAILIYGAAVYLIAHYGRASARTVRRLTWVVAVLAVNAVATSFWLGWHWPTDLIGGLFAGGIMLRLVIWADRRLRRRVEASRD